jgi:hypothetical protein
VSLGSRSLVTSSFTVVKGAMIEETYAVFAAWDFKLSKRENLDRLRAENYIGAGSASWLRDVTKVLGRRFDPAGRDRPLVLLAQGGCDLEVWKPILLWHMTRDEFLLRDFLLSCLYPAFDAGAIRLGLPVVVEHLRGLARRGARLEHAWSISTTERVAAGLLKMAAEFGLLRGRAVKEIQAYHLPERSFLYMLHVLREEYVSPAKVLAAPDWQMFLMRPGDVERELLRLHQFRKLEYQVAGSLIELGLPFKSSRDYAEGLVA